MGNGPM
jgi:hypothetical protein